MRRPLAFLLAATTIAACDKLKSAAGGDAAGADSTAAATDSGGTSGGSTVSLPVVVSDVSDGDLVLSINTTGQVRSEAEGRIRTEVAGTVARVLARPGARVRRGAPLPGDVGTSLGGVGRHVAPGPYAPRAARRATSAILKVRGHSG